MNLPFTTGQFLSVFAAYNTAIWPMHIVAYLLAAAALLLALRRTPASGRIIALLLAFFWFWMGSVYHIGHFSSINKAAYLFGALFILQGILFLASGVLKPALSFAPRPGAHAIVGALLIAYAMVVYPLIGHLLGHGYPNSPSFGVAPCPTTIFTFGLLLWADRRVPLHLLAIPLIWSVVGFFAALKLGIAEDTLLLVAGILGTAMILAGNRKRQPAKP